MGNTRAELQTYINANFTANGREAITGPIENEILTMFTNSFLVTATDFPLLPNLGGTGIANSDSRTITLGGSISTGGAFTTNAALTITGASTIATGGNNLTFGGTFTTASTFSTTGTFSSGGNFSTSSTFSAAAAVSIGATLTTTPAFTVSGSNALVLTTSGTGTTTVTFVAGTYVAAGLSLNQTFTGSNLFTGTTNTFSTGTVDFQNGLGVSAGTASLKAVNIDGTVTINDGRNIVLNPAVGTKLGTDALQKLAFWNKTPDVQPTNAIVAAAFVANTSLIADDTATFGGYTLGQIAAALIRTGILQ